MLAGVKNLTNTEEKTVDILWGDGIVGDFYLFSFFIYSWHSTPPSCINLFIGCRVVGYGCKFTSFVLYIFFF